MVMGSSTSFLLIGGGLIYIQLKKITQMYGGRTNSPSSSLRFLPTRGRKSLVRDVLIVLSHVPSLFMTSLVQTAGYEIEAPTVELSRLLNVDI